MAIELWMLLGCVGVLFALIVILVPAGVAQYGLAPLLGARDDLAPPNLLVARIKRAIDNQREGLALAAPIILIAAAADRFTPFTALGAQIVLAARIAHAFFYVIHVPLLRTASWAVFLTGLGVITLSLVGLI